jgi:hypothetical protein
MSKEGVVRETPMKCYCRGAEGGLKEHFRKYPSTNPKYTLFVVDLVICSTAIGPGEYHIVLFELIKTHDGSYFS